MKTIERMLKNSPKPQAPASNLGPVGPSVSGGASAAPAADARQKAVDQVNQGLEVLANDFPAIADLQSQFNKQMQTILGGGEPQQGPMKGPDASIPSSNEMSGMHDESQPHADAPPDRGGPEPVKGVPFWRRGKSS